MNIFSEFLLEKKMEKKKKTENKVSCVAGKKY